MYNKDVEHWATEAFCEVFCHNAQSTVTASAEIASLLATV